MTGKCYYITTLSHWQRHAARFANSHWVALDPRAPDPTPAEENAFVGARHAVPGDLPWRDAAHPATLDFVAPASPPAILCGANADENRRQDAGATKTLESQSDADAKILVLIEADEGVHLSLEGEPAFEALPHPLAQKPISDAAQSALAPHGVAPGATTFDAAEALARIHPLLRHRVF